MTNDEYYREKKKKKFIKESTLLPFLQVFSTNTEFAVRSHVCVRNPEGPSCMDFQKGIDVHEPPQFRNQVRPSDVISESLPKDD